MRFTPKTEREIAEEGLLPAGEYDATIIEAEETTSKAGNDMIVLKLRIFRTDREGFAVIRDYLLESMAFKLRHCAEACRVLNRYEQGALLPADFIDRDVRVVIGIKKDKSGQYPDQNMVKDYLAPNSGVSTATPAQKKQEMVDDEIPFWARRLRAAAAGDGGSMTDVPDADREAVMDAIARYQATHDDNDEGHLADAAIAALRERGLYSHAVARRIVDEAWKWATEGTSVPRTKTADRIIARALSAAPSPPGAEK